MGQIDHASIAVRAAEQLGLITTRDLLGLGLSHRQVERLLARGSLRGMGRGVHAVAATPSTPHQRLLAATLLAGEDAVASHSTAAWLWGFDGVKPSGIHLSVRRARNPRVATATVHRVTDLLEVDVVRRGPQPVTSPARTLLDIADGLESRALEEALDGACRRGQVYLPFLEWRLTELRRRGRRGVVALDRLLAIERPSCGAESWLESAFLRLLRDAWLPPPRIQVTKRPPGGGSVRLDAFYDDQELVAEVSGHAAHATRRQRQQDGERRARLVTMGLRVVDFTYEDVTERPGHVAITLSRLLGLEPAAA